MRKIETMMNAAIIAKRDWQQDNTRVEYEQGNCISRVYLYGNKIAEVGDNFVRIYDGGWQTNTTKSRLNAILQVHRSPGEGVFQKAHQWFFRSKFGPEFTTIPFFSGMRLA